MPYVPSEKTDGKSQDRNICDAAVELAARQAAADIHAIDNFTLIAVYKRVFREISRTLHNLELQRTKTNKFAAGQFITPYNALGEAIYSVGATYGYVSAFLGELNYAITRFIQRVPQIMVETGTWPAKNELRYWSYACATEALLVVALEAKDWEIGVFGVFTDIVLEYKRRVNTAYEAEQILKSGDCYDAPYYTRLIEVVDSEGEHVGYQEVMLKRRDKTLKEDVLSKGKIILNK